MVEKNCAYIGLGSNLQQPFEQIKQAIVAINLLKNTKVIKCSGFYKSKPMGPADQPDFINAVAQIQTSVDAPTLLSYCQQIEQQQGRIKKRHWGERCIDLDLLLYGELQMNTTNLTIPHSGILQRDFVYLPLLELCPSIVIPGVGELRKIISSNTSDENFDCQYVGKIE